MSTNEPSTAPPRHERRDADVVSLVMIGALLLACGTLVIFACWGLIHFFAIKENLRQKQPPKVAETSAEFPEPRLQIRPMDDLQKSRAREASDLNSYGWVDRIAGVVRIPIDRAMQLTAERGLPEVGAGQTPLQLMQARPQNGETPSPTPKANQ